MNLPTGTITFLFTDIEGSTKLWESQPDAMRVALERHDKLLREVIESHNGYVFKTVGDAFCAAFHTAADGLSAALDSQLALADQQWGETGPIRVRIGLHTGVAEQRDNDYFGPTLNRTARLQGVAHGQQTLLSLVTAELVRASLPAQVTLTNLGEHRLKDLASQEHLWQVNHPGLPSEFAPIKSLDRLPNNLPRQLTSFIGREKEMAEIKDLLQRSRLVTLTGSGGTGKTRLAVQSAAEVLEQYPDGAWLVELAPLADPALALQAVAGALGLREEPGKSITPVLLEYLKSKSLLLMLDNCEHLLEACAKFVDTLLRQCPKVAILATSREGLGIAGETTYRVPSLSLPDPKKPQTLETVPQFEAVRLFIERAAQIQTNFTVTNENAPALAAVCHRLDGIPLAIELAAARIRALSVEEINARLDQRFRLLTGGSRTALPRQQTLRSMIDWSYDLLSDTEKALFRRLSVFAGGWTLEAAEAVCSGEGVDDWDVLDYLTSLSDKSLVSVEQTKAVTRYRLLETVRQYARDRLLESGDGNQWRTRHLSHFLAFANEAEPHIEGAGQPMWLDRLEAEHENLRAALEWSLQVMDGETGRVGDVGTGGSPTPLCLCGAIWRFWSIRGHLSEGREWCVRALENPGIQLRTKERAKVLGAAGNLAHSQRDYASARAYHQESLDIRREIGDRSGIAASVGNLGLLATDQGDYAAARAYHEECLIIRKEIGDPSGIALPLSNLGSLASCQGDYASARNYYEESLAIHRQTGATRAIAVVLRGLGSVASSLRDYGSARAFHEESLAIFRDAGDRNGCAEVLFDMGVIAYDQGEYSSATTCFEESLRIHVEIGDRRGHASALNGLGSVATALRDYDSARAYLEKGLAIQRDIGYRSGIGNFLHNLGNVASAQGDNAAAHNYHVESLTILGEIGAPSGIAYSLEAFGSLAASEGRIQRAAILWGAGSELRKMIGSPLAPAERSEQEQQIVAARATLGDDADFDAAWAKGRSMTQGEAIVMALKDSSS